MLRKSLLVITSTLVLFSAAANAVLIDFNDGTSGTAIDNFYAAEGVTFSNARWDSFVSPDEALVGAGGLKLVSIIDTYSNKSDNPIEAFFDFAVTNFAIWGLNVGFNGARIEAYDIGGILIDSDEAFGVGTGTDNHPLLVSSAASIYSVKLFQPATAGSEGMLWDNMSFERAEATVPAPGILALFGLGLAALGWSTRKKA